ncbi:MAG: glutamyl-tRNA reductase, partial [Pseudomonadota bacterium]
GEPEILGQMKTAYRLAREASSVKSVLDRLFQHTFSAAKQVRTDTEIGREPVSVAFAAVTMARRLFGAFRDKTVLLIGAGETIDLAAQHLTRGDSVGHLIVANRTVSRAQELAHRFEGTAIPLEAVGKYLGKADLIFSSTGSQEPVVTTTMMDTALRSRKRKPVFIVDLAVPRDVEAGIGTLEDIYLYTVDDLEGVVDNGLQKRQEAARQADSVIDVQTAQYMRWLQAQDAVGLIRGYRAFIDEIRGELTDRARQQIESGQEPSEVLEKFAHQLVQKMLHAPSSNLRRAGEEGRTDILDAAREILTIKPPRDR